MGKASSNKKVQRAASTSGGRTARGRTPWVYYVTIGAIAILGVAVVYFSRADRLRTVNDVGPTPPAVASNTTIDHWHEAYAFYVCTSADKGQFVPNFGYLVDAGGIGTLGDGVIDIHPYEKSAAGKNAVLGVFTKYAHVKLNAGELRLPSVGDYGGHDFHDSDSCGGKPGHVQVETWPSSATTGGTVYKKDPSTLMLANNAMVVVAFLPDGVTIPPPPAANIDAMVHPIDVPSTSSSSTTATTTTTVPGAPTTTTTPGVTTTTTVAPTTTTLKPAPTTTAPAVTTTSVTK